MIRSCSKLRSVGEENEIHEYPTMKLFVDGTVFSYDGQGRGCDPQVSLESLRES